MCTSTSGTASAANHLSPTLALCNAQWLSQAASTLCRSNISCIWITRAGLKQSWSAKQRMSRARHVNRLLQPREARSARQARQRLAAEGVTWHQPAQCVCECAAVGSSSSSSIRRTASPWPQLSVSWLVSLFLHPSPPFTLRILKAAVGLPLLPSSELDLSPPQMWFPQFFSH